MASANAAAPGAPSQAVPPIVATNAAGGVPPPADTAGEPLHCRIYQAAASCLIEVLTARKPTLSTLGRASASIPSCSCCGTKRSRVPPAVASAPSPPKQRQVATCGSTLTRSLAITLSTRTSTQRRSRRLLPVFTMKWKPTTRRSASARTPLSAKWQFVRTRTISARESLERCLADVVRAFLPSRTRRAIRLRVSHSKRPVFLLRISGHRIAVVCFV